MIDPHKKCQTTATCVMVGHDVKSTGHRNDLFCEVRERPGSRNKIRSYYSGELLYCGRERCKWQHMNGEGKPYRYVLIYPDGKTEEIHGD